MEQVLIETATDIETILNDAALNKQLRRTRIRVEFETVDGKMVHVHISGRPVMVLTRSQARQYRDYLDSIGVAHGPYLAKLKMLANMTSKERKRYLREGA